MKRMNNIALKYGADVYFCAKHDKYFVYTSSPTFTPRLDEIVSLSVIFGLLLMLMPNRKRHILYPSRKRRMTICRQDSDEWHNSVVLLAVRLWIA